MEWLYPFGQQTQGYHKGTKIFPHVQFDKTDLLPLQEDGYNCGIGVVAAVGIILRDIIGRTSESEHHFCNIFEQSKLNLSLEGKGLWYEEWVVKLRPKLLKKSPSRNELVWGDYLSVLRSQWFVLFDRLAELQNVTIPQHADDKPPIWFVNVRSQLQWPDNLFDMTQRPAKKCAPQHTTKHVLPVRHSEDKQTEAAVKSLMSLGSRTTLRHDQKHDQKQKPSQKLKRKKLHANNNIEELLVDTSESDEDKKAIRQRRRWKPKRKAGDTIKNRVADKNVSLSAPALIASSASKVMLETPSSLDAVSKNVRPPPHIRSVPSSEVITSSVTEDVIAGSSQDKHASSSSDLIASSSDMIRVHASKEQIRPLGKHRILRKQPKRDYKETVVQFKQRTEKQKAQACFMRWWRKEKEQAKTEIPARVAREQFLVSPQSVNAYSQYIASMPPTADVDNIWQEPLVNIESREAFVQRSFESWDWHNEDEFIFELARRRKLAEDSTCRKVKEFHFAIHRAMKKERKFYRQQLEAEYMCSVDSCLESVKYQHETGCFVGRFSYKTKADEAEVAEAQTESLVYHNTDMSVDEQWVRRAFSKEVVDQIMSFDSGNADGFVPVPQTAKNVAPTRINHLPIVRVCYVHPTVRCVPNVDLETEVIESSGQAGSWLPSVSTKKFVPVSGYWKGRHANGSTIRVEENELRSKFGDAYIDQLKNMRCGFMDIPVGEYKVSQLHKYPHLRVLGAPTLKYIQCGEKDLCVSKSLASALHRLGFVREAAIINDFGDRHLEENLIETLTRVRRKGAMVLPSWIQPKVMPLGFNWESDLNDQTIIVGVLHASDGHCNHAVTIHGKWVYDANETIALPLMRETLDYCTSTDTRQSTFHGFWRGVLFQYMGTKKEKLARLTVPPPQKMGNKCSK